RDMTDVVDIAPTVTRDAAGLRIGGTGSDESKYSVDGANVNSPSFGTVGAAIVQEFIDTVEVQEAGYDAEYGGASGGQVQARRLGGSNKVRGQAVVRYTPRLADPRLISATDEALRASSVTDHEMQAVVTVTGPIIRDKLFFAVGIAPSGNINSLNQSFYHRVDKDRSGGYTGCPYRLGEFDCAPDENYILTSKFAEQTFKTGRINVGWFGRVDWTITPKHSLSLSGGGSPTFDRTTYRLPSSSTPNTFGTNPTTSLGGLARVATGIVNDHFGWGRGGYQQVGLSYSGRVAKDAVEIDAGVSYYQDRFEEAWRLDDPAHKDRPVLQETNDRGLFEVLDRDAALNLVPGVADACNASDLPGETCPIRFWISGGIGQYNEEVNRRVEGRFNLTHFFNIAATSHQLKYGALVEHVERDTISRFSGSNAEDFYERCDHPQEDGAGGEFCYDPETGDYDINFQNRVNNNRIITANSATPSVRGTTGYGRTRREQGDLRAIATPQGAGVRVPFYDARLSTENYGVFVQDRVQLAEGLYASAGVRWEFQSMRDINGEQALLIWDNVAPRTGITYDWTGEGKSRLFASYGHFYRALPLQLNSRVFGGLVTVGRSYGTTDCNGTVNINGADHPMSQDGLPTEYCSDSSNGLGGTSGLTVGSVVPRLKGQFNRQFQLGYEQEVIEDLLLGVRWLHNGLGRAVDDVSTNSGNNFIIANLGEPVSESDIAAKQAECDALQTDLDASAADDPGRAEIARALTHCEFLVDAFTEVGKLYKPPIRNYDAWTFLVRKRFAKGWIFNFSYSYSRLIGNYDGSIDRNTGAVNLGVSTQYDLPELVRNAFGPLYDNRPHNIKTDVFYQFDLREAGRLTLGSSFRLLSGTPVSHFAPSGIIASVFIIPRGSGGYTPALYTLNLQAGYAYPLPGELELEFSARLINVTNSKAILRVDENYSRYSTHPIAGGDLDDLKHAKVRGGANNPSGRFFSQTIVLPQPNYGTEIAFQQPLSAQFELRLRF
ncbi:MAG: TonB-dependent receptor, partial [Myxococcales bacterium]|nr:TonB-dependent receptor [Myxococcales bacterium]